jgi:hypothetical protein
MPDRDQLPRGPGRRLLLWCVLLAVIALVFEAVAFVTSLLVADLYDHRDVVISRLDAGVLAAAAKVDPVLGWEPVPATTRREATCVGDEIVYSIAADGARDYPGYLPADATIIVVGDSYAFGDEVGDAGAFPAVLAELRDEPVANLGVGGYGPVQALLRLERHIDRYPNARAVVLGIMYENVHRMVNSYRPVLYDKTEPLAFVPYMRDGRVQPHPGRDALLDEASFRALIETAFDTDFWAKPRRRFPYVLALAESLSSNFFLLRTAQRSLSRVGWPEYGMSFASPVIRENLFGLLDRFAALAAARGLESVVLFMPRNRFDTESVQRLIAARGDRFPAGLRVVDVAAGDTDWSRYNLENPADGNVCHPSEYGYRQIARQLAAALR